ncbi:uncharacterized protein SAPINGB_P004665 [Magnusiomyces paraingens]|uniref:ATP-dependent bile acid permease n=1 Tax=Magnusiomyces paraingens TaxID=2606893 RepID=A0A5E8BVQ7_9ASCO|nr:uncharacterized protein SAPINGB_P004665 [Saprochaete ingens]VVT55606.1 unnamed protein product [Saprochaete ingens]
MTKSSCDSGPWWVYDDLAPCYRHRFTQLYPFITLIVVSASALILRSLFFVYKSRGKYARRLLTPATDSERQPLLTQGSNAPHYVETPNVVPPDLDYTQETRPVSDIVPSFDPSPKASHFAVKKDSSTSPLFSSSDNSDTDVDEDNSSTISADSSASSLHLQEQEETNKKDYADLNATGDVTIVTVTRSTAENVRLGVEFVCNVVLVASSLAAFFIPSISKEWTSPAFLTAITALWTYTLALISIRLYLISKSIVPVVPLWAHSTTIYLLAFLLHLVTFRSAILHPVSRKSQQFNIGQSLLVCILFLTNFTAKIGDAPAKIYIQGSAFPSLEPISSIFSIISYSWIDSTIWIGYFRSLTAKDIWELKDDDHSVAVFDSWAVSTADSPASSSGGTTEKRSLIFSLVKYFANLLIISNSWTFLYSLLSFGPPFLLKVILEYVDNPSRTPSSVVWLYVFALFFCGVISNSVQGQSLFIGRRICIQLRSILIGEIYTKTLRRRATVAKSSKLGQADDEEGEEEAENDNTKDDKTTDKDDTQANHGAIINLMAVDTFKVSEICAYLHFISQGVFVTVLCVFFLYLLIGWSSFIGAGSMILLMPIQFRLSRMYSKSQTQLMAATDRRINKLNEVLQSIRIIKFFAWEEKFSESVMEIREEELKHLRTRYILWSAATLVYFTIPIVVTVLTFGSYIFIQKHLLTAPVAFTALALLNVMRNPVEQMAEVVTELLQAKVSLDRIEDFLNEKETSKYSQLSVHPTSGSNTRIGFQNATFSWESSDISNTSKTDFKLRDIDVDFKVGELNVIIGPTGSGKTSLLLALLGEMELAAGSIYLPGGCLRDQVVPDAATGLAETVAYCSQSAWLLNDTLRNNVLFGSEYDHDRYNAVIDACSLRRDLEILDAGDQTEIGEKGITLSGGQKQRVSLARAFYSNSRHLILDDCLSAVDSHTALWIYQHCLTGPLALNRTIILVSHNVALTISQASKVIVMDNGRVKAQGTPTVLLAQGHLGDDELTSASVTRAASSVNLKAHGSNSSAIATSVHNQLVPKTFGEEVAAKLSEEPDPSIIEEENDKKKKKKGSGKLVAEETKQEGSVSTDVYLAYMKAMGGKSFWIFLISLFLFQPVLDITKSWWIKIWTQAITEKNPDQITVENIHYVAPSLLSHCYSYLYYHSLNFLSNSNNAGIASTVRAWDEKTHGSVFYMVMYIVISIVFATFTTFNVLVSYLGGINASRKLFKKLLDNVLQSKIRFFDSTPIGRIMNRFSKDMEGVDQELPTMASSVFRFILGSLATTFLIAYITPGFLIFGIFIMSLYWLIGIFYLSASREIKRIDSISKSPIYQHFGETLSGVSTIRAYGVGNRFISDSFSKVDNNNRPFFYLWVANRWLSFRIDLAGALVSFSSAAMIILNTKGLSAGLAGLSLSYALTFNDYVLWIVRLYAVLEMNMNSIERLQEYMDIEKEAPAVIEGSRPPANWPSKGEIEVHDLSLRYAPDLPMVIRNVTFNVPAFSKIGIVGRTGAGKSTIITAFFRFLEAETGYIKIDGIDISKIGLRDLRQNLAIIPQDPTLFQGTIRSNLDPFDQYTDDEIYEALRRVHLIKPEELSSIVRRIKGKGKSISSGHSTPLRATTAMDSAASSAIAAAAAAKAAEGENVNLFHDLNTAVAEGGSNLSQGQRQLMCLARSLLKSPKVLLLDEATASIDYESDAQIQKTIRAEFAQTTILTIAHRLRSIADYDRILVMDAGRAVEYDHPHVLLQNTGSIFYSMCANSGELETLLGIAQAAYEAL